MGEQERGRPAAGWYPDPEMVDTVRYWDGTDWTDQRAPTRKATTPPRPPEKRWVRWVWAGMIVILVLLLGGAILDWLHGLG